MVPTLDPGTRPFAGPHPGTLRGTDPDRSAERAGWYGPEPFRHFISGNQGSIFPVNASAKRMPTAALLMQLLLLLHERGLQLAPFHLSEATTNGLTS